MIHIVMKITDQTTKAPLQKLRLVKPLKDQPSKASTTEVQEQEKKIQRPSTIYKAWMMLAYGDTEERVLRFVHQDVAADLAEQDWFRVEATLKDGLHEVTRPWAFGAPTPAKIPLDVHLSILSLTRTSKGHLPTRAAYLSALMDLVTKDESNLKALATFKDLD